MLAYKFLRHDRRGVHTGWPWPLDEWVESADVDPCRSGIHACEADALAWWLADELWVIELDGSITRARHKVVARRGRLRHPIPAYPPAIRGLGEVGAWRTRDLAVDALRARGVDDRAQRFAATSTLAEVRDLERELRGELDDADPLGALAMLGIDVAEYAAAGQPPEAPFVACCAAGVAATLADPARSAYDAAFEAERRWQSDWLAERLSLL